MVIRIDPQGTVRAVASYVASLKAVMEPQDNGDPLENIVPVTHMAIGVTVFVHPERQSLA